MDGLDNSTAPQDDKGHSNLLMFILLGLVLLLLAVSSFLYFQNDRLRSKTISQPVISQPVTSPTIVQDRRLIEHDCSPGNPISLPDPRDPGWNIWIDQDCEYFMKVPKSYGRGLVWYLTKTHGSAGNFQFMAKQGFDSIFKLSPGQELERDIYLVPQARLIKSSNLDLNGNKAMEILIENYPKDGLPKEVNACTRFIVVKRVPRFAGEESYLEFDDNVTKNQPNNCSEYLKTRQSNTFDQVINTIEFIDQFTPVGY